MFVIDNVEIPFDENWKNIAVSLSGGADSALLTYLLCDHIRNLKLKSFTIHIISHIRMWKTRPWQAWDSQRVYDWFVNEFPEIIFKRHTNFIAPDLEYGNIGASIIDEYNKSVSGDNIQIRAFSEYIGFYQSIDAYYNAVTRNPKNVDFRGMPNRDIEPTDHNEHLRVMTHMDKLVCHPFRFIEKSWIIKQYRKFNIMNLFDRTRSCEGEFSNITYKTYTPGQFVPICGKCFWCRERKWGLECQD